MNKIKRVYLSIMLQNNLGGLFSSMRAYPNTPKGYAIEMSPALTI